MDRSHSTCSRSTIGSKSAKSPAWIDQLYAAPSPTNARRVAPKKPRWWASLATNRPNGRLDSRLATHVIFPTESGQ